MIGNDIIDLSQIRQWHKKDPEQYAQRILTKQEFTYWREKHLEEENLIWKFWALKESAYKVYFKANKKRFFAPKQFQIDIQSLIFYNEKIAPSIKIHVSGKEYLGKYQENSMFLHALVYDPFINTNNIQFGQFQLSSPHHSIQSKETRNQIGRILAKQFSLDATLINWSKINKIPTVRHKNRDLPVEFSLSHHQNWGAYAYTIFSD